MMDDGMKEKNDLALLASGVEALCECAWIRGGGIVEQVERGSCIT
jgi:hypothetical protein